MFQMNDADIDVINGVTHQPGRRSMPAVWAVMYFYIVSVHLIY